MEFKGGGGGGEKWLVELEKGRASWFGEVVLGSRGEDGPV